MSIRESDMTFARQLAAYASSFKFDGVSDEAVDAAKVVLLDTLGCALGAIGCDAAAILEATVMDTGGLPEATIFGSGIRTNVLNALLVNGALVRYLEGHDNYLVVKPTGVTGCHPSDTIAMILALAERQGATGRDVLAAIVLAYQLYGRLAHCEVSPLASKGWTPEGKAPLVTPLIAGKLLQLSEAQMERAVGISGSHGFPLGILDTDGEELTMTRNIRFARVAYQGVLAAYQAARGFTGVRRVVEGNRGWAEVVMHGDFDANLLELDPAKVGYVVASPQIRQFCADGTQAGFLDATHRLVIDHDLRASDIAHVTLRATPRCVTHCGGPEKRDPRTKEEADHSVYYTTASLILYSALGAVEYSLDNLFRTELRDFMDRIEIVPDPSFDAIAISGACEITLVSGQVLSAQVDYPRGHPRNPMTYEEVAEKFMHLSAPVIGDGEARSLERSVACLDEAPSIDSIIERMRVGA